MGPLRLPSVSLLHKIQYLKCSCLLLSIPLLQKVDMGVFNSTIFNAVSYDFDELIRRASSGTFPIASGPEKSTATGFSSWVFKLSHPETIGQTRSQIFSSAKKQEIDIQKMLSGFNDIIVSPSCRFKEKEWNVIYVDPLIGSASAHYFETSTLTVDNKKLRCRPDVVFHNTLRKELLIVERKVAVTAAVIPPNFYPNILAQLWCYAQIDYEQANWPFFKNILLGAELWSGAQGNLEVTRKLWLRNDRVFKKVEKLFEIYSK